MVLFGKRAITPRNKVFTPSASADSPTYCDALQVLVDELDANMSANFFGIVSCNGKNAMVTLEPDYFSKMKSDAQQALLTGVKTQWFEKCYGNQIKFVNSITGGVIADYSKGN